MMCKVAQPQVKAGRGELNAYKVRSGQPSFCLPQCLHLFVIILPSPPPAHIQAAKVAGLN